MTAVSVLGATAVWSRPACLLKVLAASAIAGAAAVGLGKLEKRFYFTGERGSGDAPGLTDDQHDETSQFFSDLQTTSTPLSEEEAWGLV